MPTRRGLLAGLAALLAGCGQQRTQREPEHPGAPLDYDPRTPETPTPRQSPLSIDESFSWPAPLYDAANTVHPPTTGPTDTPAVEWEVWLPDGQGAEFALVAGRWLYVLGDGQLAAIDRRQGWLARADALPVDLRTWPTLTEHGLVGGALTAERNAGIALVGTHGERGWRQSDGTLVAPPAVDDGRIYHLANDELVGRESTSGTVSWRHPATDGERFVSIPAVGGEHVYAHGERHLYAVDAATGEPLWHTEPSPDHTPASAVSVGEDFVFAGYEGDSGSVAYERRSGEIAWQADAGLPVSGHAVAGDRAVVATASGRIVALSRSTGDLAWQAPGAAGQPIVAEETVYVRGPGGKAGSGGLTALALADGSRRWHRPVGAEGWVLVADGHCYLNRGSGVIRCLA